MSTLQPQKEFNTSGLIPRVINSGWFTNLIMALIVLNSVMIGLETYPVLYSAYKTWFLKAEKVFLWIFTVEILLRISIYPKKIDFFKDSWNIFDFFIIASAHLFMGAHFVSVLRILRVLRVLRTISVIPSLQRLVEALLRTIPSLGNILILMTIIFYIFAVKGTILFAHASPELFGSLHRSLLTLFQVVTLESWASGVMRPIMETAPYAWAYFVAFILVGTFVVFNLFVGVIVNNVQQAEDSDTPSEGVQLAQLQNEIRELKTLILEMQDRKERDL